MAIEVITATIDGAPLLEHGSRGYRATVPYLVTGLDSITNPFFKATKALDEVPDIGDAYPNTALKIRVLNRTATMEAPDRCRVSIVYGMPDYEVLPPHEDTAGTSPLIEIGAVTQEVVTTMEYTNDGDKKQIVLEHEYTISDAGAGDIKTRIVKVTPEVMVAEAHGSVRITRTENNNPAFKAVECTGTVNKEDWNGADTKRKWYCQEITGRSTDGCETFVVHYHFLWHPRRWDRTLVFVDEETRAIPQNLKTEGDHIGIRDCRVLTEVEWNRQDLLADINQVLTV